MVQYLLRLKIDRGASGLQGSTANEALSRTSEGVQGILQGGSYLGFKFPLDQLQAAGWKVVSTTARPGATVSDPSYLDVVIEESGSLPLAPLLVWLLPWIWWFLALFGIILIGYEVVKLLQDRQETQQTALLTAGEKERYRAMLDLFNNLLAQGVDPTTAAAIVAKSFPPPADKPKDEEKGIISQLLPLVGLLIALWFLMQLLEGYGKKGR